MPNKPEQINRAYKPERKPFERSVDSSWFYNDTRWRRFTHRYKQRHPLCKPCDAKGIKTPTYVVDHKHQYSPTAQGWDLNNLKDIDYDPMCSSCHNSRSGKQSHNQ